MCCVEWNIKITRAMADADSDAVVETKCRDGDCGS